MADIAHYAGLIAAGLYPSPVGIADFVTSTTHKTLRGRAAAWSSATPSTRRRSTRGIPGLQGGPLMHVIAAKAVALGEALRPEFQRLPGAGDRECAPMAQHAPEARPAHRLGPHRVPHVPRRPAREEHHRQGRRGGARPRAHHGQQERDPERSAEADGHQRHAHRHAGDDHARLRRAEAEQLADLIADVLEDPATRRRSSACAAR